MLFLLFFVALLLHTNADQSHCRRDPMCTLNEQSNIITCDGMYGGLNQTERFPTLACFPPMKTYLFRNFLFVRSHAFHNITFLENESVTIRLANVTTLETDAFSYALRVPESTRLMIEIGQHYGSSSISMRFGAFGRVKIDRLSFINIHRFNGRSTFDTISLSSNVKINELVFDQCAITGFSNMIVKGAEVNQLSIRNSPTLTQITDETLPIFFDTTKTLEISNTGLQLIQPHLYQGWTIVLEEIRITNNSYFESFPSDIFDGKVTTLNTLDLSYNSIKSIDMTYDWSPFSYAKHLLLRQQQIDLFLQTNLLPTLSQLETIDLSEGFISENHNDFITNNFRNMTRLTSLDISHTNLTENMVITILKHISQSTTHFVNIGLYGRTLSDDNFCSYFQIFQTTPNLFYLQLDETHECNCVVDLFYDDQEPLNYGNGSVIQPKCLSNSTRTLCDIDKKVKEMKCKVGSQNPDNPNTGNRLGNVAFGSLVGGSVLVVLILISLGFSLVYRMRSRRNTDVVMEQPFENPLVASIEECSAA